MKTKFLKRVLWLVIPLLTVFINPAWADEELVYTLDGTSTGGSSGYDTESDITQSEKAWKAKGNTTQNPWRIGGKKLTSATDRSIYNVTEALSSDDISTVILSHGAFSDASKISVASVTLIVSTASNGGGTQISSISRSFKASDTIQFHRPGGTSWANRYFKIVYSITTDNTNSNRYFTFNYAKFYKEATSCTKIAAPVVTATPGDRTITLTWANQTGASSYTVTKTPSGGSVGTPSKSGSTWSCAITGLTNGTTYTWSVEAVGSGDYCASGNTAASASATPNAYRTITYYDKDGQHTTSLADGTNIATALTALYGGDDPVSCDATNYEYFVGWKVGEISGTASSVTLLDDEVVNSSSPSNNYYAVWSDTDPSSGSWTKVGDGELTVGDKVVFVYDGTAKAEMTGISGSLGTSTDRDAIPDDITGDYILTIEAGNEGSGYSFKNGSNYLSWSSGNSLTTSTTKDNASSWTISTSTSGNYKFANVGTTSRILQYNSGSPRWACYTSSQQPFQIYKQSAGGDAEYITTCCTKLDAVNGSVAWTNPSEAVLTWDNVANVSSWTVTCNVHSGSAVGTVGSITTNGSGKKTCTITGLACNTNYDFTITGTPTSSTYCEASQTLENQNSGKWSVSYSLSDVTKTSGPETGANVCGDFSAVFEATNSKILPAAITVQIGGVTKTAGTDYTWDQSTGALSIASAKITGAISITITGTAPAYAFWYGEKGQSWTSIPFASVGSGEHQITGFVMPNYEYEEGLGQMYWNVAGSGITATNREFYAMSFAQTQSSCGNYDYYNDGTNKDAWIRGAAAGAKGTLRIYDYKGDNGWCAFIPDEYILKIGTSEVPFIVDGSDANVWETALTTLSTLNGGSLVSTTKYRVGVGDASHHFVQVYNKCAETNISSMGRKTGAGDSWATDLTTVPAAQGKFRIWINNCTNGNWECHFVPYYQLTYDANGGSGSMAALPATPISCEETVANRTITVGACTFTAPTGKEFKEWNTQADGNGTTVAQGNMELTSDVKLHAIWKDANYSVTIMQSPDAGATTTGQTSAAHYNETINLTTTEPDGYRFVNWTTSDGFSITNSTSATTASFTMPNKNVTVTANFVQTHSITWMVNGASYSIGDPDVVVDHGGSISTLPTAPTAPTGCPDKVFMGWSEKNSGTTAKDDSYYDDLFKTTAPSPINSDKIFYAVFADEDDSGGSGSTDITISSTWTKSGTSGGGTAGGNGVILVIQDGVTLTHPRAYVNTDVRMYKDYNCVISVVSPSKITRIEVTTADADYDATGWDTLDDNYETSYDSGTGKWNGVWANATGATSVTFGVTKQVRLSSIKVYYTSTSYDNYVTLCSSCTTPSDLAVSGITSTGGKVTWSGVSVDDGFKVLWSTSSSRPEPTTGNNADVAAGTNEYTISGLTPATRYYVWVQSKCNSEWSSSSADFYTNAKITYTAGTGASGSMDPKEVTYNTNATVDACTFDAPSGKTFNGWVSNTAVHVNGGGSTTTAVPAEATINNLTAAITLTAQWRDLAQYHVTFSADNGTVAGGASQTVTEGGTLTFPNVTSTTCGTFSGWVEAAYDNTAKPTGATYHAAGDELAADPAMDGKTYYAVYRVATGAPTTINDVITSADLAATGVSYASFDDVSKSSSAVYKGETAKNAQSDIQLRTSGSSSGIVSKISGGLVKKVTFVWGTGNASGRTVDIYGKNTAYTAASDLYGDAAAKGTSLGSIVVGTSTEVTVSGDYEYVGIRSNSGAAYIASITIQWYGAPMKYQTSPVCSPVVGLESSFSAFTYVYNAGPSAAQSFTVSGNNLSANLVVTAPTNYEVSKTENGTYTSSVNYTPTEGTVSSETVYIRLAAGRNVGTYNYAAASGVSVASEGATTRTAALNGSVTQATGAIAFTNFNAVDHYEAEMPAGASGLDVTLTVSVTGDGAVSYSKSPTTGVSPTIPATQPTTTLHVLQTGTWAVTANLAAGTNYTSASTSCQVVVYYADRFYDNIHADVQEYVSITLPIVERGSYDAPDLMDADKGSANCAAKHYKFMGWVSEANITAGNGY